jgi:hypothetical protein
MEETRKGHVVEFVEKLGNRFLRTASLRLPTELVKTPFSDCGTHSSTR